MVIQILPFTVSDHPGTDGPILVYDFDGASSVAYTECNGGGRIVESADEVGDLMTGSSRAPLAASGTMARLPKKGQDVTTPDVARMYDYVCHERGGSPAAGLSD